MNDTTTASVEVLSRTELLPFLLPVLLLSLIGIVSNGIIVYLYESFKTLRAEGGMHSMALLAICHLLSCSANLQVLSRCIAPTMN